MPKAKSGKQKKPIKCWMCRYSSKVPKLGSDGFHYHGQQRCTARPWVRLK